MALKVEDGLGKEGMQVVQEHVTRALYEMIHTLIQCPISSNVVVLIGAGRGAAACVVGPLKF